jgi:hypothetical protein
MFTSLKFWPCFWQMSKISSTCWQLVICRFKAWGLRGFIKILLLHLIVQISAYHDDFYGFVRNCYITKGDNQSSRQIYKQPNCYKKTCRDYAGDRATRPDAGETSQKCHDRSLHTTDHLNKWLLLNGPSPQQYLTRTRNFHSHWQISSVTGLGYKLNQRCDRFLIVNITSRFSTCTTCIQMLRSLAIATVAISSVAAFQPSSSFLGNGISAQVTKQISTSTRHSKVEFEFCRVGPLSCIFAWQGIGDL